MDLLDTYIGSCIKRLAEKHRPPANGKMRLLQAAALSHPQYKRQVEARFVSKYSGFFQGSMEDRSKSTWSIGFDWAKIYTTQFSMLNMRVLL